MGEWDVWVFRLGRCFRLRVWLGYVAGLWRFDCRMSDVEVNGPGMLPGPVIAFALCLYDVSAQGGSPFNNSTREVFVCCWQ